jgi:hypothetical protein
MTRKDQIYYAHLQRDTIITVKSLVVSVFWRLKRIDKIKLSGFAGVLLGLQMLTNATLLHSKGMIAVSLICIIVGNYIIIKSK